MWPNRLHKVGLHLTVLLLMCLAAPDARASVDLDPVQCVPDQVVIATEAGARHFQIEIADTVEERAQGLMFRREVPEGRGMLFIYDRPTEVSFWMRNTLVPLDLIFIDARGVIRHIHRMAKPLDETPIPGAVPGDTQPERLMVLEIAGGDADQLGLASGQALAHPRLDRSRAAWPCE